MELTIHTGIQGDRNKIYIDWFDENNVRQKTALEINIKDQDKPRTLELVVNNVVIAELRASHE